MPNGPLSAVVWLGESINNSCLTGLKWYQGLVHKWFGGGDADGNFQNDVEGEAYSGYGRTQGQEDEMGFEGWFDPGDPTHTRLDEGLMDELYALYGDPGTYYADGVEMWSDFGVVFNVGMAESLSAGYKESILSAIREAYPGICQERLDVVQDALDHLLRGEGRGGRIPAI